MATKLNQIIAIEKGVKNQVNDTVTRYYHLVKKPDLFTGINRTYKPRDEEGEQLPGESNKPQLNANDVLRQTTTAWTRLLDVTATKDYANCDARADVVVDGQTLLAGAPVPYLIWLEKQLGDLRNILINIPVLDPSIEWSHNDAVDAFASPVRQTTRTKKLPRNHVKAEATDKHPAQVDVYQEDVVVGYWDTINYSGALPQAEINAMLERNDKLQQAVKMAREAANDLAVTDQKVGESLFEYVLG